MQRSRFCERCGVEVSPGASFCSNCGASLRVPQWSQRPPYISPVTASPPTKPPVFERPNCIKILAIIQVIGGISVLAMGGMFMSGSMVFLPIPFSEYVSDYIFYLTIQYGEYAYLILALPIIVGILFFILAYGIWRGKGWSRTITLILNMISVTSLATIPLNVAIIYYLYRPNVKAYFGKQEATTLHEPSEKIPKQRLRAADEICRECGEQLTWIPQYNRYYCYVCGKYPPTCPDCGMDLFWAPQYNRFYCRNCAKYLDDSYRATAPTTTTTPTTPTTLTSEFSTEEIMGMFQRLREQHNGGLITEKEYEASLKDFKFKDEAGKVWTIGAQTGRWYHHKGGQWVLGSPPQTLTNITKK